MPANISNVFDIVVDETLNNSSVTITNPGRPFRVVGTYVTGGNGALIVVRKNTVAGDIVSISAPLTADDRNDYPSGLANIPADVEIAVTDNLFILEAAAVNVTRVVIKCEASNPQVITVT